MAGPQVAGYDVVELLGRGADGETWLGHRQDTGEVVLLDVLPGVTDLVTRDRLRREVAVLAGLDHPHLLCPRSVLGPADATVVVRERPTGPSLADLLAQRPRLRPGEVVTLAVPLAQALSVLHARGLVHGDVTPAAVHLAAGGRPQLVVRVRARPVGTPAEDVHGLAVACFTALAGHPPYDRNGRRVPAAAGRGPLLDVIERTLGGEPADRPSAAELGVAVYGTSVALPVRRAVDEPPPAGGPAPGGPRRRARGRRRAPRRRTAGVVLLGASALAAAAVAGVAWAAADDAGRPRAVAAGDRAPTDWEQVLADLDAARSRAFETADPAGLDEVYAVGSPALARDRASVSRLADAGLRTSRLSLDTLAVDEVWGDGRRARLRVDDVLGGYQVVDAAGRVVASHPGRGRVSWAVTLTRSAGRWLVYDVGRA